LHQIVRSKRTTSLRDGHEGIGRQNVGPARRKRHQTVPTAIEEDAIFAPILAVTDQRELSPLPGMKGMRHTERLHPAAEIGCK